MQRSDEKNDSVEDNRNDDGGLCLSSLQIDLHINFLKKCLSVPISIKGFENIQITMLYFIIGSLAMLNQLSKDLKEVSIQYVLSQMIIEDKKVKGFRGSSFTGFSNNIDYISSNIINKEDLPHLPSTYSGLSILTMCGINITDIKHLNKLIKNHFNDNIEFEPDAIAKEVSLCQREDGSFYSQKYDGEYDVRFIYCALCIMKYIGFQTQQEIGKYFNLNNLKEYLNSIWSYEGGFSMIQEGEANGGLTYCSIASYIILGIDIPHYDILLNWLINRASDQNGVNGRTNKLTDSCYSFWIFATITLLGKANLIDTNHISKFVLQCQTIYGGFSKHSNKQLTNFPDILHTYYSLATLSLLK